jgi:hypothetical protein
MLPDSTPDPTPTPSPEEEVEPVSAEEVAQIIEEAIAPYLADEWRVIDRGVSSVRLTRGMRNLDIYVDLLGQVERRETGLTPLQETGRLTAWVLLLASLLVALALAAALGIL